ncbi:MAG: barstar family protein, partial [Clostridia bacterium]|nr:barstar family protein [Clostridia bacterium]
EAYELPEYFGNNLSALWDCLRYSWEEDIHRKIVGLNTLPNDLREYMNRILEVFDDVHRENPNMTFEIVS